MNTRTQILNTLKERTSDGKSHTALRLALWADTNPTETEAILDDMAVHSHVEVEMQGGVRFYRAAFSCPACS